MPYKQKKTWFIILGMFFLGILFLALVDLFSKKALMENNIKKLQMEIGEYEKKNGELVEFLQYLKSDAFLESKARENFDLAFPEEKLIIIKSDEKKFEQEENESKETTKNNFKAWFDYFFRSRL